MDAAFDQVEKAFGTLDFLVHSGAFANNDELKGSFVENTIHTIDFLRYLYGDISLVSAFYLDRKPGEERGPMNLPQGFIHPALHSGKADFSRVVPCRCSKGELRKKKADYLEKYSNLGSLSQLTFDNLSRKGKAASSVSQERFAQVYQRAKAFADNPKGWLVFSGPSGSGKRHLACAVANHRLKLGEPVFYTTAADLLDHLRSTFSPTSDTTYDELFEQVKNVPLLVLDDRTLGSATAWAKEKLEQLLHHRFNARLATVITSDVPPERMDERLRGHLIDSEFCQVLKVEQKTSLESRTGLELELLRNMTFDNFDHKRLDLPPEQRQNLRQAYNLAVEFARSPEGWLIFQGVNGCGKTHLAAAIGNARLELGEMVIFVSVPELLDGLRATFSPERTVRLDPGQHGLPGLPSLEDPECPSPWSSSVATS